MLYTVLESFQENFLTCQTDDLQMKTLDMGVAHMCKSAVVNQSLKSEPFYGQSTDLHGQHAFPSVVSPLVPMHHHAYGLPTENMFEPFPQRNAATAMPLSPMSSVALDMQFSAYQLNQSGPIVTTELVTGYSPQSYSLCTDRRIYPPMHNSGQIKATSPQNFSAALHHHHHHHHFPNHLSHTHFSVPHHHINLSDTFFQQTHQGGALDHDCDPKELEMFAERFKQRRVKLGVTQADVGSALANLKIAGVGCLSQSTICRFESLTLSHNNMIALKPILLTWLDEAERQARDVKDDHSSLSDRKRKRTSIATPEKRSLEAYFAVQPRPSGEKIAQIAEKLDLKKNVVRVWFCNQRQKQKRMKFSANGLKPV